MRHPTAIALCCLFPIGCGGSTGSGGEGDPPDIGADHGGDGERDLAEVDLVIYASEPGARAGTEVSALGDLDGDGVGDLGIAAPGWGDGTGTGMIFVVSGDSALVDGGLDLRDVQARIVADSSGVVLGVARTLAGVGDLDGDGADDLAVGSATTGEPGTVFLFHGPVVGEVGTSGAVASLTDLGLGPARPLGGKDLDDDGDLDLVVASPEHGDQGDSTGEVAVFLGPLGTSPSVADVHTVVRPGGDHAESGTDVDAADMDGDGGLELLVGAPGDDAVYVVQVPPSGGTGSVTLAAVTGRTTGSRAGSSVTAADLDGDGHQDLVMGAPLSNGVYRSGGVVYVVAGPVTESTTAVAASAALWGPGELALHGWSVAKVPDTDGDGADELLVGSPQADAGHGPNGEAWLYRGPVEGHVFEPDLRLFDREPWATAGAEVTVTGDVDGDQVPELMIGALLDGRGAEEGGAAFLVLSGGTL